MNYQATILGLADSESDEIYQYMILKDRCPRKFQCHEKLCNVCRAFFDLWERRDQMKNKGAPLDTIYVGQPEDNHRWSCRFADAFGPVIVSEYPPVFAGSCKQVETLTLMQG